MTLVLGSNSIFSVFDSPSPTYLLKPSSSGMLSSEAFAVLIGRRNHSFSISLQSSLYSVSRDIVTFHFDKV